MDEPFSGLDRRLRDEVREDTLEVLRESRVTCVIVTHDPEEALRMADRIALMRAGGLVQVDTPEGIYRRPADLFVARFFCELNEVAGKVRGGMVETPLGRFAAPGLAGRAGGGGGDPPAGAAHPPGRARALPGRLERRRFLGDVELVEVAVDGARPAAEGAHSARRDPAPLKLRSASTSIRPKSLFLPRPKPSFR